MIDEKISKHLGKPYIYLKDRKKFLCSNGVLFTLEEFKNGIDINAEYERRAKEDNLYDYQYAKNTGILRKKRGYAKKQEDNEGDMGLESNVQESKAIEGNNNDNKTFFLYCNMLRCVFSSHAGLNSVSDREDFFDTCSV